MMSCRKAGMIALVLLGCSIGTLFAQSAADYAVQVSAVVTKTPAQITLVWPADARASSYTIYRKAKESTSWGNLASVPGSASNYTDSTVSVGGTYEYRVDKTATISGTAVSARGYIYAGIEAPLVDNRGKVILLVDDSFSTPLAVELTRLQQDLVSDGWTVLRREVSRNATVVSVKALVTADFKSDPVNTKALFLFGHIPVPYSGNYAPDGHPEHVGAWPADVYYGDMDGTWTDSTVNNATAADLRNRNVPGDGKFDQNTIPSDAELHVGRVDLSNLPLFAATETELLRRYLNKDHNFRAGLLKVSPRSIISDNFGSLYGEAFAANGWRNFASILGGSNITSIPASTWTTSLSSQSAIWGYGCGAGGYSSAQGVTTSSQLSTNDPCVVFTMFFGSYFGDWDSKNNFLRAPLATPTYTLASVWAGRPNWFLHHMALGETIGFGTRLTQNNSSTYTGGNRTRGPHIALMGDPTLRMHPIAPPQNLLAFTNSTGGLELHWTASADPVIGYHVYSAPNASGPFTRLTSAPVAGTSYSGVPGPSSVYMVRAVRLETSAAGTYYNASLGVTQNSVSNPAPFAGSRLTLRPLGGEAFLLSGTGLPGQVQQIQARDSLNSENWVALGTVTNDASGQFRFTTSSAATRRFYRTMSQP